MLRLLPSIAIALATMGVAGGMLSKVIEPTAFEWNIPASFPRPAVPADNPMSVAKVALGRHLFYDRRMSVNGQQSCASCHRQELAFTDGRARSVGTTGETHPRSSMSLANVAYNTALTWADPRARALEDQALVPMLGAHPIELGLGGREAEFLRVVQQDSVYRQLFASAYSETENVYTTKHVVRAIAAFERTLLSMRSPYDKYRYGGEANAISESAKRGEAFFFSGQHGGCFQCHGGWNFTGSVRFEGRADVEPSFFNTGLYNLKGASSYPAQNTGVHGVTGRAEDMGKFRAPTLRNIAVTAPYMHDGSVLTLDAVLDHYAAGGRTIANGRNAGVGHLNPNKAPNVDGFTLTAQQRRDVIAFLESLTDSTFLTDTTLSDPWRRRPRR
ncbi:MAG: di-heme enzyme [Gemmatimonadaceae bacterium]|nr:di-heme enzyme [Gemmatimonadaceae bacterium]